MNPYKPYQEMKNLLHHRGELMEMVINRRLQLYKQLSYTRNHEEICRLQGATEELDKFLSALQD